MNSNFFLQIFSLIYMLSLSIIFESKEKIDTIENKLFKYIMTSNIIGLIIELTCFLLGYTNVSNMFICKAMVKLYLIYLVTFVMIFTIYVLCISSKNKRNKERT